MKDNIKLVSFIMLIGLVLFFFFSIGAILAPFIISIIIAYLLDPLTKKLEKRGLKRKWTVSIIVGVFSIVMIVGIVQLVPILFKQIHQFIIAIPKYEEYMSNNVLSVVAEFLEGIDPDLSGRFQEQLNSLSSRFFEYVVVVIRNILNSSMAILNIIILALCTPVLVFYLLRDWPSFVKSTHSLLPLLYKKSIIIQLKQMDKVLSAYVRGQINVCLILSLFYIIGLSIVGLDYALLIGIIIGTLTIIPYLGVALGFIICIMVALLQFSDMFYVFLTMIIFVVGHILESSIITPRLIGSKVGLHPVWIIFALMSGGVLFGFWGMFFAIPVAAVLGVLLKGLLKFYFASNLYRQKGE
ncbi:MAG: AI-2E family transporter [Rickettsiales bacterium]|jgi:putative permease|nr:AI-2E family transporter [Rickettsiales bacterium]